MQEIKSATRSLIIKHAETIRERAKEKHIESITYISVTFYGVMSGGRDAFLIDIYTTASREAIEAIVRETFPEAWFFSHAKMKHSEQFSSKYVVYEGTRLIVGRGN